MRNIKIMVIKQLKDTLVNKSILIQFILMPFMAFIMTFSIHDETMAHDFFIKMFASMYIGMAPIIAASNLIAEEKETGALNMLFYANVKALEYLCGIGIYILILCMTGVFAMTALASYSFEQALIFMLLCFLGIIISTLIGCMIGIRANSQIQAVSWSVPIMMLIAFVPMIATFNEWVEKIGSFLYTQQIRLMMDHLSWHSFHGKFILIIILTFLLGVFVFVKIYRQSVLQK